MSRGYTDYRSDNPYAQQDAGYSPAGGYGGGNQGGYGGNQQQGGYGGGYGQRQNGPQGGYGGQQGQAYEMNQVSNQDDLLRDVQEINDTVTELERRSLPGLERLHQNYFSAIDEAEAQQVQRTIDAQTADISATNRAIVDKLRRMKGKYGGNNAQVSRVNGKVEKLLKDYRTMENQFSRRVRDQLERQYRIVNQNATEAEVQEFLETGESQVFSQAVMHGGRTRQAESTLANVQSRHEEIQRIEKTLIELAQLFEQMNQQIVEQESKVEAIETHADNVRTDIEQGVNQTTQAVTSARAARRKKWWCLLIAIIIIIVIAVIVVIVVKVVLPQNNNNKRRSLEYLGQDLVRRAESISHNNLAAMNVRRSNYLTQ